MPYMLNVSELKTIFSSAEFVNYSANVNINSVEHDTRRISAQSLYVAIKGESLDGHDFIIDAQNKGAVACICERKIEGVSLVQIIVKDSIKAYGVLARYWRNKLKCPVLALTGSNGKTTTKDLIYTIMSKKFKTVRTTGNFNNLIGVPYTILSFPLDAEFAVVEMGMNAKGEIASLSQIADPDAALITNIGRAHIGKLGSIDAIKDAKTEVFDYVLKKKGSFCINSGDERIKAWVATNKPKNIITYCCTNVDDEDCLCEVCVRVLSSTGSAQRFKASCTKTSEETTGEIRIAGIHNMHNVAAAIAVGVHFGVDLKTCVQALNDFIPPSMRSNVMEKDGVTYIVDCYNANPDSMLAAIRSLSASKEAIRKVAVLGDMADLDGMEKGLHKEVGKILAENGIDLNYVIGTFSGDYEQGFNSVKGPKGKLFVYGKEQMDVLRKELFSTLKKGDYVLIKASRLSKLEAVLNK